MNTKADAVEAASDGDWKTAAAIYREIGDEFSARQCDDHIARQIEARAKADARRAADRERARETRAKLAALDRASLVALARLFK